MSRPRPRGIAWLAIVTVGLLAVCALSLAAPASASIPPPYDEVLGNGYQAISPYRLMDTREGQGGAPLGPGETRILTVTGVGPLPGPHALVGGGGAQHINNQIVRTIAVNVTVTNPSAASHLRIWDNGPEGLPDPTTSNINFAAGQTVANLAILPVSLNGTVAIRNNIGTVDVVIDAIGWAGASSGSLT